MFERSFRDLAKPGSEGDNVMMNSTHQNAHHTVASLDAKGDPAAGDREHQGTLGITHLAR